MMITFLGTQKLVINLSFSNFAKEPFIVGFLESGWYEHFKKSLKKS